MSSTPPPQAHERQIDWLRAAFAGAIAGGVLWAVVIKVLSILDKALSMEVRLAYAAGGVFVPVLVVGLVLYRLARRPAVRVYAVALFIAPCTGLVLLLFMFAIGLPELLTGR
ncbi:hypothetical protein [Mycobacterium riyadhense]|uniref:Uncharacterized protein n=1 Tax=Mycobacterium riyadhense TaxID=486698 RepID=A0A1X2CN64_9MYCO|nr:hypothetical protein [Mycobacterium riyadhense]MCV7147985.1 hypothetical protein [Mycobacterium riyadhense]ORW77380.1 hypothetical protein AWC22_20895 [Mycobacterium riyadhense]